MAKRPRAQASETSIPLTDATMRAGESPAISPAAKEATAEPVNRLRSRLAAQAMRP
jgi:hypothetical protein